MIAGRLIAGHMPARLLQGAFSAIAVAVAVILLCKTYAPGLLA
jgi:hypothetical protein